MKLTSKAAIDRYLVSMGYNPRTFVFQRGTRNYAGRGCPGATWNCTTARRVVQVSTRIAVNEFKCTPSGSGTTPGHCVIVQVSQGGLNNAVCTERMIDEPMAVESQSCEITQQNTSGKNIAHVTQKLQMSRFASLTGTQDVSITQSNGRGSNSAIVRQTLTQSSSVDAQSTVSQNQSGDQDLTINQTATGVGGNSSDVQQLHSQLATASNTTGSVSQQQNADDDGPDTQADIDQTSSSGRNSSLLDQSLRQEANAGSQTGPVTQTQGSPTGGLLGTVNQSSSQPSTSTATQNENQILTANTPAGTLTQTQFGPSICCATQTGSAGSTASIQQTSFQTAGAGATQTNLVQGHCETGGSCSASQTVTNNDGTTTNSDTCTGSGGESCIVATQVACDGTCEPGPIVTSEETFTLEVPDANTVFTFDVTTSASAVELLLDTLDCCIAGDKWGARLIAAGSGAVLAEACGDGNIETFSGLATASGFTAYRAEVFYCEGVDVFPAGLEARFRSSGGTMDATATGSCVSPTKTCEGIID